MKTPPLSSVNLSICQNVEKIKLESAFEKWPQHCGLTPTFHIWKTFIYNVGGDNLGWCHLKVGLTTSVTFLCLCIYLFFSVLYFLLFLPIHFFLFKNVVLKYSSISTSSSADIWQVFLGVFGDGRCQPCVLRTDGCGLPFRRSSECCSDFSHLPAGSRIPGMES